MVRVIFGIILSHDFWKSWNYSHFTQPISKFLNYGNLYHYGNLSQIAALPNMWLLVQIVFSSNLEHAKLQKFLPMRLSHGSFSGKTKTSKFLSHTFSWYNFEKLILTLSCNNFHKILHCRCLIGFWMYLNNSWTYLNMLKYALIHLNLPEWLLYCFPIIIPCRLV